MSAQARLGRPPASSSAATRARILDVARRRFATGGYEATSNRSLAEEAGLTTGAIYHYFNSKLDIYTSVYDEAQTRVYARFDDAIDGLATFMAQLDAVLEAAHELNREDPSLALFLGSSRVDAARDPSLADALRRVEPDRRRTFFADMIEVGVATGEIDESARPLVAALIRTLVTGLVDAVSGDTTQHRAAIDAIKAVFDGKLVRPVGR
ncbi:MAG: TetR/AcrR family transcriptional regulator [Actinomycetota bacterium]|jgi:AcrR family transcriptional regulator|nr:TetR/AcrR family transcriptional regulator [Actinomycetota bacterium]